LASTYKGILSKIGKAALAKAELHLSTKVTSIASGVNKGQESSVAVTTVFGQVLNFDEVIVTCPLGWLKRNVSSFLPPLPSQIIKAINDISYGRLEKVYLTFPRAFWHQGDSGGTSRPFFSNFLSPTYTDQNPKHWTVECALLDSLPHSCAHPTLLFYVHGPCAQHVTSLIDGLDTNSKQHYQRLNDFFGPYYSRLPNFSSSSSDCKPTAIIATNWQNDEFSGWGSYTTFQTSQTSDNVQLDQDIEALREGCPEQRVWFAGEHTAPFVALGTTTGAYWSGQAVAQRLAEGYGM